MLISLQEIIGWLIQYKYAVIFPITVFEGPIVTVIAGFLAAHGILNIYISYGVIVCGDLVGDLLYYSIGRWGRKTILLKWGYLFGVTEKRVEKLEKHFEKHSGKTLIAGKISHGFGSVILFAAGAAKMPVGKYLWFNLLGTLPKSLLFLLIGYYFGAAYKRISTYIDYTTKTTFVAAVLLIIIYFLVVKIVKKESKEEDLNEKL